MRVFIANFGLGNRLWPECMSRPSVATYEDEDLRPFWEAGDREGYIAKCVSAKRTAAGITPTKPVASRWFNLATIISSTSGDIWIHREKDELWWTSSLPMAPQVDLRDAVWPTPTSAKRIYVIHKPAAPWSNRSKTGTRLSWGALHPKAREFLFTEGTLQQLSEDHARYALASIEGADLTPWHSLPLWSSKQANSRKPVATVFSPRQNAAVRMATAAFDTAAQSNGQEVTRIAKNKEVLFASKVELEQYVLALIDMQDGLCALTGLRLQYDGDHDDNELLCSLDRIDSDGHYEPGNLQVVCRFANRWKNADNDENFRRLVLIVRAGAA